MAIKQTDKESALWERIIADMRQRGDVGEYGFDYYISKLSLRADTGTELLVEYPADLPIAWVDINYKEFMVHSAAHVLDAARRIEFVMAGGQAEEEVQQTTPVAAAEEPAPRSPRSRKVSRSSRPRKLLNSGLNSDFRFDNFVVGGSNEFAHAAAQAVAATIGHSYNPLFIHGGSGLGKTHLLQAIGNAIHERDENIQVLYVTSEDFTNAYIDAIASKGEALSSFRRRYRKADVLLIDDVQFLASKDKTKEELFHTFNALFTSGKQIVLSADCAASELTRMGDRLSSRFEQGLTVSLQPPCFETRMAILRNKRSQWKCDLVSDEVLTFLAQNITRSVRRLEGALTRLATLASFTHRRSTVAEARLHLKDLLHEDRGGKVSIKDIQRLIAEEFDIRVSDLTGRRRTANIAHPRQLAMFLARRHTESSLQDIGAAFGGRDHGTVIHAARTIEQKLREDPALGELVQRVSAALA